MKTIRKIQQAFEQFLTLTATLTRAVEANTATVAELRDRLTTIAAAATSTAAATAYLHRAEHHRRQQAGQRSDF